MNRREWSDNDNEEEGVKHENEHVEGDNQEREVSDDTDDDDNEGDPDYVETGSVTREHFDFLKKLGIGAYGTVFLVKKNCGIDNGRIYAMKVISKDKVVEVKPTITLIKTERKALELVRGCPYIPNLYYSFQTDEKLFIVMDYIPGGDLFTLLLKGGLDEGRVRFYIAELVIALEHIHKHDLVYRDIKLENILIDADGHIKLVDFGLSKQLGPKRRTYSVCGTPDYLAPEICNRNGYGTAVDWWSVGVLTVEMLTGESAFGGGNENMDQIMDQIRFGEPTMPQNISHQMKDFILKMLNKNPLNRLGGNKQLATDIKNHSLFYGMDWSKLEKKELPASYKPTITDAFDVQHFSDEFTSQSTDCVPSLVPKDTFLIFKGYSYIAPELERIDSLDDDNIAESLKAMSVDVFNQRQPESIARESCSPLNNAELIIENQHIISIRAIKKKSTMSEVSEEEDDGLPVLVENSVLNGGDAKLENGNNSIESPDLHSTQIGKIKSSERHRWITPPTAKIHEVSSTSTKAKRIKMNASNRRTKSPKLTDELSARKTLDQQIKKEKSEESGAKVQFENIRETRRKSKRGDITSGPIKVENCDTVVDVEKESTSASTNSCKSKPSVRDTDKIKKKTYTLR